MAKFVLNVQLELNSPKNATQVIRDIERQFKAVNIPIKIQGADAVQKDLRNTTKAVNNLDSATGKMAKSFAVATRRFAAFSVATRTVTLLTNKFSASIDEAIKFQREINKISQVTGKSVKNLRSLTTEITRLSTTLGVSSTDLAGVARSLSQAGFKATDLKVALSALAKTSLAPTFEDISKTAEGAIAIFNQFGQGAAALERQLGAINAVAGKFAVESGDLIGVVSRVGGVFKSAGGSLEDLIALFTSVRATTRESSESIATGLRTIFTRIQRPSTIAYLERLNVELTDAKGNFVGPYKAIKALNEVLGDLPAGDLRLVQIAEELGGFRQIGKVLPLLQQFTVAEEARQVAMAGGQSLTDDVKTAQQALAVQIAKVREEWQALVRSFTESGTFQFVVKTSLSLASALAKILEALKPLLPALAAFGAIKGGQALAGGFGIARKTLGFASGGIVPGTGNRDTVPAMLTPGEFVIKKSSVESIGAGNLSAMNKYAKGGNVSASGGGIGIFDSDQVAGGKADKDAILQAILGSKKPYKVIAGPAGAGKTTYATKKYGSNFVLTPEQVAAFQSFAVISGAGQTKSGGFSPVVQALLSGAGGVTVLDPGDKRLQAQRQKRLDTAVTSGKSPDQRSVGALKGTLKAPGLAPRELYTALNPNTEFVQNFAKGGIVHVNDPDKYAAFVLDSKSGADLATKPKPLSATANRAINITEGRVVDPNSILSAKEYEKITGQRPGDKLPGPNSDARKKLEAEFNKNKPGVSLSQYAGITKPKQGQENTYKIQGPFPVFGIGSPQSVQSDLQEEFKKGSKAALEAGARSIEPYLSEKLSIGPLQFSQSSFDLDNVLEGASSTIEGYMLEAVVGAVGNLKTGGTAQGTGIRADFDFPSITGDAKEKLSNLFDPNDDISQVSKGDAKRTRTTAADKDSGLHNKIAKDLKKGEYTIKQMATGGGISGSDTVPAMLTPGEFVINRSAARSIGRSNLESMNKHGVKGFNKGGAVQYLNGGGSPKKPSGSGFDFTSFSTQAGVATLALTQLVGATGEFGGAISTISTSLIRVGSQIQLLNGVFKSIQESGKAEAEQHSKNVEAMLKAEKELGDVEHIRKIQIGEKQVTDEKIGNLKKQKNSSDEAGLSLQDMLKAEDEIKDYNNQIKKLKRESKNYSKEIENLEKESKEYQATIDKLKDTTKAYDNRQNSTRGKINRGFAKFGKGLNAAAQAAVVLGEAASIAAAFLRKDAEEKIAEGKITEGLEGVAFSSKVATAGNVLGGAGSGAATGAIAGAALGSAVPIIGNIVGAGIGAVIGGTIGGISSYMNSAGSAEEVREAASGIISNTAQEIDKISGKLATGDIDQNTANAQILDQFRRGQEARAFVKASDDTAKGKKAVDEYTIQLRNLARTQGTAAGQQFSSMDALNAAMDRLTKGMDTDLKEAFKETAEQATKLNVAMKATEKANLDLAKVNSLFGVAATATQNFINSFETGSLRLERDNKTVQTALTSLGGVRGADAALTRQEEDINSFLRDAGIDKGPVKDIAARSIDQQRQSLEFNRQFAARLSGKELSVEKGVATQEVKDEINKIFEEGDFSNEFAGVVNSVISDMEKAGGVSNLSEVFQKITDSTSKLSPAEEALTQAIIQHQKTIQDLTKRRRQVEEEYIKAQETAIDNQITAAKAIEEFGGKKYTQREEFSARVKRFNLRAADAGVDGLRTGSASEIREVAGAIKTSASELQRRQVDAAKTGGNALGVDEDRIKEQSNAAGLLVNLSKERLGLLREEIKIAQKKVQLEKSSIESLLSGNVEDFFKKQAGAAAAVALRSGDTTTLNALGGDAVAQGVKQLQEELSGRELEQALLSSNALQGFGLNDRRSAQLLAGTTPEVQGLRQEGLEYAKALQEISTVQETIGQANVEIANAMITGAKEIFNANLATGNVIQGAMENMNEVSKNLQQVTDALKNTPLSLEVKDFQLRVTGLDSENLKSSLNSFMQELLQSELEKWRVDPATQRLVGRKPGDGGLGG